MMSEFSKFVLKRVQLVEKQPGGIKAASVNCPEFVEIRGFANSKNKKRSKHDIKERQEFWTDVKRYYLNLNCHQDLKAKKTAAHFNVSRSTVYTHVHEWNKNILNV